MTTKDELLRAAQDVLDLIDMLDAPDFEDRPEIDRLRELVKGPA